MIEKTMNLEELYWYLNDRIEQIVDSGIIENVVIYPFGRQGMLVKQILNDRYGVSEAFICDEKLSKKNPKIKSLNYLEQIDVSKYYFIITSENYACYDEVRENIRRYVEEKNIIDFFSRKPLLTNKPRIAALEMASREIYDRKISGAVAEAGVYKGGFASYINRFFKDRKLYLFDTFEGFSAKDIEMDKEKGYTLQRAGFYSDTSISDVLGKMPFVDRVVIKKGYFPQTTEGIKEQFCFVSLDMDLYQPIKAGLEYFYPRLSRGGYIFVHDTDIGHDNYKGARVALMEFVEKEKIGYVMLPDTKTAVITKGMS